MFIQTEATPNPATLKFLPGKVVMETGTAEFRDGEEAAAGSALAARLFQVPGVTGVYFGYDFITVTKDAQEWHHLKPAILGSIMEHFMSGQPIMAGQGRAEEMDQEGEFFEPGDETIVATIKNFWKPAFVPPWRRMSGDITFKGFRDGTVFLNMKGACSGCPSSTATLKHGVQNLLHHFIPEVQSVEAV